MVALKHLKSRHGECRDVTLRFEKAIQRFTPTDLGTEWDPNAGPLSSALRRLWGETEVAGNGSTDDCGFDDFKGFGE